MSNYNKDGKWLERTMAIIWIVSWFGAIWFYHLQLFLTGLLALAIGLIGVHGDKKTNDYDN